MQPFKATSVIYRSIIARDPTSPPISNPLICRHPLPPAVPTSNRWGRKRLLKSTLSLLSLRPYLCLKPICAYPSLSRDPVRHTSRAYDFPKKVGRVGTGRDSVDLHGENLSPPVSLPGPTLKPLIYPQPMAAYLPAALAVRAACDTRNPGRHSQSARGSCPSNQAASRYRRHAFDRLATTSLCR